MELNEMNNMSRILTKVFICSLLYIVYTPDVSAVWMNSDQNTDPLRVLMLTSGESGQNEYMQKNQIEDGLRERITKIELTFDHEEAEGTHIKFSRHETAGWAEEFDLVIYNQCHSLMDEEYVEQIMSAHAEHQLPAVLLHCSMSTNQNVNDKWFEFAGAVTYVHENSTRPLIVEALEPHHPIMVNFPKLWRTPADKLMMNIELKDTALPLARAYSEMTKSFHDVAWINEYEGVRVFNSSLGNSEEAISSDVNLNLIAAGLLWATNNLEENGEASPGYDGERGLGWISLWDGETFNGWRASEVTEWSELESHEGREIWPATNNPGTESFRVLDDKIVVNGPRSNLFYEGAVAGGDFRNFEFKADIYFYNNSQSGFIFHTRYQDDGIPNHGYRALFSARGDDPQGEHEWFTFHVKMDNGNLIPQAEVELPLDTTDPEIVLNRGTIALHSSSPNSRVYYRNLLIRLWPD
jgi:uncharacterized protein